VKDRTRTYIILGITFSCAIMLLVSVLLLNQKGLDCVRQPLDYMVERISEDNNSLSYCTCSYSVDDEQQTLWSTNQQEQRSIKYGN